jgi:putative tryptophan/tyrosine transport system substrate-binding protein
LLRGDPEAQLRSTVLAQSLQQSGWTVGRNLQIDYRFPGGEADRIRQYGAELVALAPDVILTVGSIAVAPMQQATRTIPIVFTGLTDPVGAGIVQSLARPGGNATGFTNFEYSMSGKWVELLKQIAPNVTRAAVLRDPTAAAGIGQFAAIQSVAQSLGVELTPVTVRDTAELDRSMAAFARSANGGMISTAGGTAFRRDIIIRLVSPQTARRLPGP